MSDDSIIHFPSASSQSKLSAPLSTKVPQSTNWIYQDVYHSLHHDPDYLIPTTDLCQSTSTFQMTSSLFEACKIVTHDSRYSGWDTQLDYTCPTSETISNKSSSVHNRTSFLPDLLAHTNLEDSSSAPVLIESTFSSSSSSSSTTTSSSQSVQSFRCSHTTEMMSVGNSTLKKRKSTSSFRSLKYFIHAISPSKKPKLNPTAKKFFQFFKR
ncbi:hypothetical protein BD770DRAFT_383161 [Pilaira anomala]|nr:hypothetical protein BD770DRAFT_383161 [Pilaira anomala]